MARKRDGLVPIGEVLADLPGPVKALRKTPPPARRGFTVADQVNQLVSASDADPDRGFIARTMALCSLPRTNPSPECQRLHSGGSTRLVRQGHATLVLFETDRPAPSIKGLLARLLMPNDA